jgi:HJR/Mrr/RecB family endonuclease
LRSNPQLVDFERFAFEQYRDDPVNQIIQDHEADVILNKEARKWATRITRENHVIRDKTKALKGLLTVASAYTTTPEFATPDAQLDVEQQIDDNRNALRKAEVCSM